jgi:histidyl-tRNA synthetase
MALSTQPYKGARDFYPDDKRLQKYLFGVMRSVVERYGYEEYDAPILEPLELYTTKTSDEIVNDQTYQFVDRGGRQVVIRPEMTPTVSRMVAAKRQELTYPLRWYSIPNLWRYERPQHGRLREHWQLNVDLFGIEDLSADLEVIQIADALLKAYGATHEMFTVKVNSRRLTNFILAEHFKLTPIQQQLICKLIDRMHKMDEAEFAAEIDSIFVPSQRPSGDIDKLLALLKVKKLNDLPEDIRNSSACEQLEQVLRRLEDGHVTNAVFDITLMRGFDYYTGIVFEIFDTDPANQRSLLGGGRYDGLVGLFGVEPVATVGFGLGDVSLQNFLTVHDLLPKNKPETDAYVVLIGDVHEASQKIINDLREMGLNLAVDLSGGKADKQIKNAVRKGINYAIFIGDQELADEQYTVKNLVTGQEERHSAERIISIIKDYRGENF